MEATSTLLVLKSLAGNPPVYLNTLQLWLAPHERLIIALWWTLWVAVAVFMMEKLVREYTRSREQK